MNKQCVQKRDGCCYGFNFTEASSLNDRLVYISKNKLTLVRATTA